MKDVNKVILVGRLGRDPVQRETKSGLPVVQFPLATNRRVRDDAAGTSEGGEEWKDETQWHRVYVWGKQGVACAQSLRKGNPAFVEGSLRSRKYVSKDGEERVAFEVHADTVSFLGGAGMRTVEAESALATH